VADEAKQGDERTPYVMHGRAALMKHGIAYGREPMATECW